MDESLPLTAPVVYILWPRPTHSVPRGVSTPFRVVGICVSGSVYAMPITLVFKYRAHGSAGSYTTLMPNFTVNAPAGNPPRVEEDGDPSHSWHYDLVITTTGTIDLMVEWTNSGAGTNPTDEIVLN